MSVSCKSISPAVLAALVLAACGGGSDGSNTAVSGSPKQPSVTQTADGSTSTNTPAPATGSAANGQSNQGTQPSAPPTGAGTTPTDTPPTVTPPTVTNPPAGADIPFYSTDRIRGDALLTMLDAKAPVFSRAVRHDNTAIIHWEPERMFWTTGRTGERNISPAEGFPYVHATSRVIYENGTSAPGSHEPDDLWQITYSWGASLPGNYKPIDDPVWSYPDGQYTPAKGNYILQIGSFVQQTRGYSASATKYFLDAIARLPVSAGQDIFTLGNTITLDTRVFNPNGYEPASFDVTPFNRKITLTSDTPDSFGKNAAFLMNSTIKVWGKGENRVSLSLHSGDKSREVNICWEFKIKGVLNRTQCSIWTVQKDWEYGQRFSGGAVYMEDWNELPVPEPIHTQWFIDGSSSNIFRG